MERVDSAAALLAGVPTSSARPTAARRLRVTRSRLAVDDAGFTEAIGTLVAASYLSRQLPWAYPDAPLVDRLPYQGSTARKGENSSTRVPLGAWPVCRSRPATRCGHHRAPSLRPPAWAHPS